MCSGIMRLGRCGAACGPVCGSYVQLVLEDVLRIFYVMSSGACLCRV